MSITTDLLTPLGAYLRLREGAAASFLLESVEQGRLGRHSFIGAGTPPNIPSWGNIMAEARSLFQIAGYLILFPGIFLSLTVLAVNLLGDGMRDALDPRLARRL